VSWDCDLDVIRFISIRQHPPLKRPTKRTILARIAVIFDPLGLLGPSVIIAKLLMQRLWRAKIDWDESIPNELHTLWREYESKLQCLDDIEISRKVITFTERRRVEIHGFSDASEQAYGTCIYIRTTSVDGQHESHLLCSKSRVAPLKALSIPRLELCGALLLAQLTKKILKCLPFAVDSVHLWTDPLSRGIMPHLLSELQIWWSGPSWLESDRCEWPSESFQISDIELPEGRATTLIVKVKTKSQHDIFNRFSKFHRLIHVIAFCYRFIKNCRTKDVNSLQSDGKSKIGKIQSLSITELEQSELALIRIVQREVFKTELHALESNRPVNKNSNILNLNPFIDVHGILRVGGRLRHASVAYNYKHPILLPGRHPFTRLVITHEHERHLHAGAQATLSALRQNYWPTSARNIIRSLIRKCIKCVRNDPRLSSTLMADLPETRVNVVKYVF